MLKLKKVNGSCTWEDVKPGQIALLGDLIAVKIGSVEGANYNYIDAGDGSLGLNMGHFDVDEVYELRSDWRDDFECNRLSLVGVQKHKYDWQEINPGEVYEEWSFAGIKTVRDGSFDHRMMLERIRPHDEKLVSGFGSYNSDDMYFIGVYRIVYGGKQ